MSPSTITDEPAVYVGTYAKYNSGSIAGGWINLEDHTDLDSFYDACRALHPDEADPEFMFQDWQCIPEKYISESSLQENVFDWIALDDDQREIVTIYQSEVGYGNDEPDTALEAYCGTYNSEEDWAAEQVDDQLSDAPAILRNYFDYEAYARDCRLNGDVTFVHHQGEILVFTTH